ncbi:MAG: hypothetical protein QME94_15445 [Anaerolineae bacterium]|nr:hypothetical protein [Anaerolineae bacterium]
MPKMQALQVRALGWRRNEELLWARLVAYARRPAFRVDLRSAFGRFWNADYDLRAAQAIDLPLLQPFLEWYIYDYRTSEDRQRIIDLFVAEEGPRLGEDLRAVLAEREVAYLSLFGVEQADREGYLEVGDLLAGGFYRLEDAGLARLAMPGDLLLGRRLGSDGTGRLSSGTVLLPATLGPLMTGAARRAFGAYRDEHYQATWPEFLREAGYVMYHCLISPEATEAYERAPHPERYYDPRAAVERMRAIMRDLAEEQAKKQEEEEARRLEELGEAPATPPVERTPGGILVPGQPKATPSSEGGILLPEHLHKPSAG